MMRIPISLILIISTTCTVISFSQAFAPATKNVNYNVLLPSQSLFPSSSSSRPSLRLFSTAATSSGSGSGSSFGNNDNHHHHHNNEMKMTNDGTTASTTTTTTTTTTNKMHPIKAKITKAGMISFVASMCIALPATLYPVKLLHNAKVITTLQKEIISCRIGCFCSRWLIRLIPFANVKVIISNNNDNNNYSNKDNNNDTANKNNDHYHIHQGSKGQTTATTRKEPEPEPEPSIWVCNHTSMLDIFFLLAKDKMMRGKNKRPIKIIYWKDLEKNPVTKLLFTMSGFIPVEMEDNGNGSTNSYKKSSFKALLKSIKKAFEDGFDIGILPEGQLNPSPEKGLQPVFGGAFTLAKMSKRPIKMMAIHGLHHLWHGDEKIGMTVTGRKVTMRNYNFGAKFGNSDEFVDVFKNIVGHFGATGKDHPAWKDWMMTTTGLVNQQPKKATTTVSNQQQQLK